MIHEFLNILQSADAILVGGASGMSAAAGFRHYYEHDETFVKNFGDFEKKYGYRNSFDGFYYRYRSSEERWAFIAREVVTIIESETGQPYFDLAKLLEKKEYHILTTNQDTQFTRVFSEDKISAIQGDWRYLQCRRCCQDALYDAIEPMKQANAAIDENMKIPSNLIPRCPRCGSEMEPWVRGYHFLEGQKYEIEYRKLNQFLEKHQGDKLLFLELGVGRMTPMFIQEPFWRLTARMEESRYVTINPKDALVPKEIADRSLAITEDIAKVLSEAVKEMNR